MVSALVKFLPEEREELYKLMEDDHQWEVRAKVEHAIKVLQHTHGMHKALYKAKPASTPKIEEETLTDGKTKYSTGNSNYIKVLRGDLYDGTKFDNGAGFKSVRVLKRLQVL